MSVRESRNRRSLAGLRDRMVRRAETVLGDRGFGLRIAELRSDWNRAYPQFPIHHQAISESPFSGSAWVAGWGLYAPIDLAPVLSDVLPVGGHEPILRAIYSPDGWQSVVARLRDEVFPPSLFPYGVHGSATHPTTAFVSACLVFDLYSIDAAALIPELRLLVAWLPYPPYPEHELYWLAHQAGRAEVLEMVVSDLLRDDPERLDAVLGNANRAGHERYESLGRRWGVWGDRQPQDERWHFIPVTPEVGRKDLQDLAGKFHEFSAETFGSQPVNSIIRRLAEDGYSQQRIADLVGVSVSTVERAVRES